MTDVDALALRARLEEQLDSEANAQVQRIVDDLLREQARDDDHDSGETTIVIEPDLGPTRRLHIYESDTPGFPYALEEAERENPDAAWHHKGRERLHGVVIDGRRYGATARVGTGP